MTKQSKIITVSFIGVILIAIIYLVIQRKKMAAGKTAVGYFGGIQSISDSIANAAGNVTVTPKGGIFRAPPDTYNGKYQIAPGIWVTDIPTPSTNGTTTGPRNTPGIDANGNIIPRTTIFY